MSDYEELAANVEHSNFANMVSVKIEEEINSLIDLNLDYESLLYAAAQSITYLKISDATMNSLIATYINKAITIINNLSLPLELKETMTEEIIAKFRADVPKILAIRNKKVASQGGKQKTLNDKDGKQAAKRNTYEWWKEWQQNLGQYKSKAAFATAMLDKHDGVLTSIKVICDWCTEWEKESCNPTEQTTHPA